jgi:hypothetical protein
VIGVAVATTVVVGLVLAGGFGSPAEPAPLPPPDPIAEPIAEPSSPTVAITIDGAPADTAVLLDGKRVGNAPVVRLPRSESVLLLELSNPAYYPTSLSVVPDRDTTLHVRLEKRGYVPPPPKKKP